MLFKAFLNKYIFKPKINNKGKNNKIYISPKAYLRKVCIDIYGNDNEIFIDDLTYMHNAHMTIGFTDCYINNCKIHIGKQNAFNSLDLQLGESGSEFTTGNYSIFSFNLEMCCSDTHCIFDENNNLINVGKKIEIGSHVWVGKNVIIMKNTKIPNGCIVGMGSVITKKFEQENAVIAGNPARVVKEGVRWNLLRPQQYLEGADEL